MQADLDGQAPLETVIVGHSGGFAAAVWKRPPQTFMGDEAAGERAKQGDRRTPTGRSVHTRTMIP